MLVGDRLMPGVPPPVPDSETVGLPALLEIVATADRAPSAVGLNVSWNEQLVLGARLAPVQVSLDFGKSPGLVPPTETLEMDRVAVPVLVTVTPCGELELPTV